MIALLGWLVVIGLVWLALMPFLFPNPTVNTLRKLGRLWAGVSTHTVNVDGCDWAYWDNKVQNKPVLLLLHGFASDKDNWLAYTKIIGKQYRVIAADIQGYGESPSDAALSYTVAEQVQRLKRFTEELGLASFHVCGNSMGGFCAGMFSAAHPETVLSLMLMNAAGLPAKRETVLTATLEHGKSLLLPRTLEEVDNLLAIVSAKPFYMPRWAKTYMLAQMLGRDSFYKKAFSQLLKEHSQGLLGTQLGNIQAPSLVLWGRNDQLLDVSAGEYAAAHLANSRLVILDNIGHIPMIESPRETWVHHQQLISSSAPNANARQNP